MISFEQVIENILKEAVENNGNFSFISANNSIKNKIAVEIEYIDNKNGSTLGKRVIYPHLIGMTIAGKQAIRAYQPDGVSTTIRAGWKIFIIDKIIKWTPIEEQFELSPKYNSYGDKMFRTVYSKSNNAPTPVKPIGSSTSTEEIPQEVKLSFSDKIKSELNKLGSIKGLKAALTNIFNLKKTNKISKEESDRLAQEEINKLT